MYVNRARITALIVQKPVKDANPSIPSARVKVGLLEFVISHQQPVRRKLLGGLNNLLERPISASFEVIELFG